MAVTPGVMCGTGSLQVPPLVVGGSERAAGQLTMPVMHSRPARYGMAQSADRGTLVVRASPPAGHVGHPPAGRNDTHSGTRSALVPGERIAVSGALGDISPGPVLGRSSGCLEGHIVAARCEEIGGAQGA